jgi:F0F1-type ATP synthase membrane subunit a
MLHFSLLCICFLLISNLKCQDVPVATNNTNVTDQYDPCMIQDNQYPKNFGDCSISTNLTMGMCCFVSIIVFTIGELHTKKYNKDHNR